ncbi:hypothetical protein D9M71_224350 [compost metagenome]
MVGERQRRQAEDPAHLAGALALGTGQRDQVEHFLEQAARRFELRVEQQLTQVAVDARQQLLACLARAHLRLGHGLQCRSTDPAQARALAAAQQIVQSPQRPRHQLEGRAQILLAQHVHQAQLIHLPQAGTVAVRRTGLDLHVALLRTWLVQTHAEEVAFRQARLPRGLAQLVDDRQQQLGNFLAMDVDAFQVAAQHEQRLAQRGQLPVALLTGTGRDIGGQQEDLLGQQLGPRQLDQFENSANLLQVFNRLLQQTDIESIGDEQFQALLGLFDGREQLAAHQTKGCGSGYHALCPPPTRYESSTQTTSCGLALYKR